MALPLSLSNRRIARDIADHLALGRVSCTMLRFYLSLAALSLVPITVGAQELEFGASANVQRPRASVDERDATTAASELNLNAHALREADADVVLRDFEGLTPQRLGGAGSQSSLSIRGAAAAHTDLLIDGLPLSGPLTGGPDLSSVRLEAFDQVRLYRGGVPAWIGLNSIGGVINLLPHASDANLAEVQLGIGSWGERRATGRVSLHGGAWAYSAHVYLRSSEGDFSFRWDPTPLVDGDTTTRKRQNADLLEGQVLQAAHYSAGKHQVKLVAFGYERTGGVPGPAVQPTNHVRRQLQVGHLAVGYAFDDVSTRVDAAVALGLRQHRFSDRFAEIGLLPRQSEDLQTALSAHVAVEHDVASWLSLVASARGTHFVLSPSDALRRNQIPGSHQSRLDVALEPWVKAKLGDTRVDLRPSFRLSYQHSKLADLELERGASASEQWIPGFRLAAGIEPTPGIYLSASASHLLRTPTVSELFGDRAFLRGNTSLRAERATQFDVGIRSEASGRDWRGSVALRGYASLVDDLIRYTVTSQYQAVPGNLERAEIFGAELGAQGSVGDWSRITLATGVLHAIRPEGGSLPLRPPFHFYVRIEGPVLRIGEVRARSYADVYHLAGNFTDDANLVELPSRTQLGAGVRAEIAEHLGLVLRVDNILDQKRQDVVGFPLPGRGLSLLLSGKLEP